VKVLTI